MSRLKSMLVKDEGYRERPYEDSEGVLTIGVGRNLEKGLSFPEVMHLLENDISEARMGAERLAWVHKLNDARKDVVLSMIFNLGLAGFLEFKKTIAAIRVGDYATAAREMLDSKWARQIGERAVRLASMMRTGEYHRDYLG